MKGTRPTSPESHRESCDAQSRGLTSSTEGLFAELEWGPREAPGPAKAGSQDHPPGGRGGGAERMPVMGESAG